MKDQELTEVIKKIRDLMEVASEENKKINYKELTGYLSDDESQAISKIRECYEKLKPLSDQLEKLIGQKVDIL